MAHILSVRCKYQSLIPSNELSQCFFEELHDFGSYVWVSDSFLLAIFYMVRSRGPTILFIFPLQEPLKIKDYMFLI